MAERAAEKQAEPHATAELPAGPGAEARRDEQRAIREIAETAHGVNLDLGAGLLTGLSTVDPADMTVARFFVYSLLGSDYDNLPYTQAGERVSRLAMSGIRLVIDEFRADVTKTRKDGSRGKLRIDYGDSHQPEAPVKWLWKFVDGAKTAGELYGRALVVIAAEQYASRLVVPQSQRAHPTSWSSHKDHAEKALKKLAGPHLPGSLRQVETAIKRAHDDCERAERAAAEAQPAGPTAETEGQDSCDPAGDVVPTEADVENSDDEGPAEPATA